MVATEVKSGFTNAETHQVVNSLLSVYYRELSENHQKFRLVLNENTQVTISEKQDKFLQPAIGQDEIMKRVDSFKGAKFHLHFIDSQNSVQGGIIATVFGTLSFKEQSPRNFVQTFFLAKQPTGYYVLNDLLRFTDETPKEKSSVPAPVVAHPPTNVTPISVAPAPVVEKEVKPVAPIQAPQQPAKDVPRTWATLAAIGREQWGSTVASVTTSSVKVPESKGKQPIQQQPQQQQAQRSPPLRSKDKPVEARRKEGRRDDTSTVFARNVTQEMSLGQLRAAFASFGDVKNVTLMNSKSGAFVDFESTESAKKALQAGRVSVNQVQLTIEERQAAFAGQPASGRPEQRRNSVGGSNNGNNRAPREPKQNGIEKR